MSKLGEAQFPKHWRDTGCHLHDACLTCPRAVCIHDEEDQERRRQKRQEQVQQTVELMDALSDKRAVAQALGIGRRALERRLQAAKGSAA